MSKKEPKEIWKQEITNDFIVSLVFVIFGTIGVAGSTVLVFFGFRSFSEEGDMSMLTGGAIFLMLFVLVIIIYGGVLYSTISLNKRVKKTWDQFPALIEMTKHKDYLTRQAAVIALADKSEDEVINTLIQVLRSNDNSAVRKWAAWSLGEIGEKASEAVPVLLRIIIEDKVRAVSLQSVESLSKIGTLEIVPSLIEMARSYDEKITKYSNMVLEKLFERLDYENQTDLIQAAEKELKEKKKAADSLVNKGKQSLKKNLEKALKQFEEAVKLLPSHVEGLQWKELLGEFLQIQQIIEIINQEKFLKQDSFNTEQKEILEKLSLTKQLDFFTKLIKELEEKTTSLKNME